MSNSTKTGDPITNLTGRQMVPAAAEPIGASGLAHYVATHVSSLTGGAQTPGVEVRFHSTVFATGLWARAARAR